MDYDAFKLLWLNALHSSGLRLLLGGTESMDLRAAERRYETYVEPDSGQDAGSWFVTARLAWHWDALLSARSATTEEDLLAELFDRARAANLEAV